MRTRLGLLGFPVGHSLSPRMHNAALEHLRLPYEYHAFEVPPEKLGEAVKGMAALGFIGCNVTIPHKVAVMQWVDELSAEAKAIGAVNTLLFREDGSCYGTNTDGIGYVRSLTEETGLSLQGISALVLGAGGAARAICYSLLHTGVQRMVIANRSAQRGRELVEHLRSWFTASKEIAYLQWEEAEHFLQQERVQLVVNTTSVGMHPHEQDTPLAQLPDMQGVVASDLIYNPRKTRFLRLAEEKGAMVHGGLGMFVYQGAEAFQLWTGHSAPIEVMRRAVDG